MRISPTEKAAIVSAARAVLPAGSRVLLFGSRTDDHLYRLMGERHIDILVASADEPDDRLVVAEARRHGLEMVRT